MKILITGGHFTPAISLISSLQKKTKKPISIIFVGRKFQSDSEKTLSLEYKEIIKQNVEFIHLDTGRLTRILDRKSVINFFRIPIGFINAFRIIQKEKPDMVFSFGGYIAFPISFLAWCFRIPVYTHEQTIHPGLANRLIGRFAKKIFVSFEESKTYFDEHKVKLVGNLVRETVLKTIKKPFTVHQDRPVLYVTGGSLGSHSINIHLFSLLPKLLKKYTVIHQLGDTKEYADFEKALVLKKKLAPSFKMHYFPRKHFIENEIGYIYSVSDLVIGRAGANTFFELVMLQKPALFIPLPWAAYNEQEKHAEIFKTYKTGELFHQSDTDKHLLNTIEKMINNLESYKKNFASLQHLYKTNAADSVAKELIASC